MTDKAAEPAPQATINAADVHYGILIALPAKLSFLIQQARTPAAHKVDVMVCFGNEAKTYTYDEFLMLLGFNNVIADIPTRG